MKSSPYRLLILILALAFVALGWMTGAVLKLEREEYLAARATRHDNDIRSALSRINSFMFRFIGEENNRSLFLKNAQGVLEPRPIQNKPDFVRFYFALTPKGDLQRLNASANVPGNAGETNHSPGSDTATPRSGESLTPEPKNGLPAPPPFPALSHNLPGSHPLAHETPYLPHWQGNDLIFLKQVPTPQGNYTFAIWVDWLKLKEHLLTEIKDTFPQADIQTYLASREGDPLLSLATLPARLIPGEQTPADMPLLSTLRIGLLLVWAFILVGAGGLAALLRGTVRLSERRAAFVSAVTHELRTPLTNFSLYTEMLDEGLVPEEKKGSYLRLLRAESTRLIHLVENVLAFARIEKRSNDHHLEIFSAPVLFDSLTIRIREQLAREGTAFHYRLDDSAQDHSLLTDKTAVEQILGNLVDNSLKYGTAEAPEVSLEIIREKNTFYIHFRDNGPGIAPSHEKDLFSPFTRSAEAAAGHKPGVGLGLALARDTARMLKGELSLLPGKTGQGVHFILKLPSL